jgi:hypothetical protein
MADCFRLSSVAMDRKRRNRLICEVVIWCEDVYHRRLVCRRTAVSAWYVETDHLHESKEVRCFVSTQKLEPKGEESKKACKCTAAIKLVKYLLTRMRCQREVYQCVASKQYCQCASLVSGKEKSHV